MRPGYDIVVPVYNGVEVLGETLDRLARHLSAEDRVIIVDDASPDARVAAILGGVLRDPRFRLHRHARTLGFVAAANLGFSLASRDVVLLNADAWVTPGWLDRLHECRASSPRIACACPLSNNATLLSIEHLSHREGVDPDAIAQAVARASTGRYVRLPTANGFCMLMTREALDRVGGFDPAFGRGYGEENDWSMRAIRAGYEIACADRAYVHHIGGASFRDLPSKDRLRRRNAALLSARWPGYAAGTSAWCRTNPLRVTVEKATREIRASLDGRRARVLLVAWHYGHAGGIEEHLRVLLPGLAREFDTTVLCLEQLGNLWWDARESMDPSGARLLAMRAEAITPSRLISGLAADVRDAVAESFFEAVLAGGRYDVVHFHSLVGWNSLELPVIARRHGCRVAFSLHDFFLQCPDGNLVGPDGRPCGKARASPEDEGCLRCLGATEAIRADQAERTTLATMLAERRHATGRSVSALDRILSPSAFAAGRFLQAFPDAAERVTVVAHGVEIGARLAPPPRSSVLRVAFVGRFSRRKGAIVTMEAARLLLGERVEFRVHGLVASGLPPPHPQARIRFTGEYRPADLPRLLADADLVLIPSVMEETFSLVFNEALALGIPVVASPAGAIAERLVDGENGFAFPLGDAKALADLLRRLSRELRRVEEVRERVGRLPIASTEESASRQRAILREMLSLPAPSAIDEAATAPPMPGEALARLLRVEEGPAKPAPSRASGCPVALSAAVLVRVAAGRESLLARTLASIGPAAGAGVRAVVLLGEGAARPLPPAIPGLPVSFRRGDELARVLAEIGEEAVLGLEAGDEAEPELLALGTRRLADEAGCLLVAFDDGRVTLGGERYGRRLHAGVNRGAMECGVALGRVVVRASVLRNGPPALPCEGGALAVRLMAEKGRRAVSHVPGTRCWRIDLPDGEEDEAPTIAATHAGSVAVIVRCEEARPVHPEAVQAWLDARMWDGAQVVVLGAEGDAEIVAHGAAPADGGPVIALGDARDPVARLDRVISALRTDAVLVQSDRILWPGPASPRRLLAALALPDVAMACPVVVQLAGLVQHAGFVLGSGPAAIAGNALEGCRWGEPLPPPFDTPHVDVSAVGRLAFAFRRKAWVPAPEGAAGAVTLEMAMVERSLGFADRGWRIVACLDAPARVQPASAPFVEAPATPAMREAFLRRWLPRLVRDPCHSTSLALNPPWQEEKFLAAPWMARPPRATTVVALPSGPTDHCRHRLLDPLAAMAAAGLVECAILPERASGRVPTVSEMARLDPDVIVVHGLPDDRQFGAFQDYARYLRARRILSLDEASLMPDGMAAWQGPAEPGVPGRLGRTLALFDRVIVPSAALAGLLAGATPDVRVIPGPVERSRGAAPSSGPGSGRDPMASRLAEWQSALRP